MEEERIIIELIRIAQTNEQIVALLKDANYSVGALEAGLHRLEESNIMLVMQENHYLDEGKKLAIPLLKRAENISYLIRI